MSDKAGESNERGGDTFATFPDAYSINDALRSAEEHIHTLIKSVNSKLGPSSFYDHIESFASSITWSERWIQGVISFHILLLVVILLLRKNLELQFAVFLIICVMIYCSEYLNSLGAIHWKDFSTQNYFDRNGVFMSIFFAGPLLFIGFVQLVRHID